MLSAPPYDEMRTPEGVVRPHYCAFADWLERTPPDRIAQKRGEAERIFHRVGITFAVYGEQAGTERLIPFDLVPRIIPADEWARLEAGLAQRVRALNLFLRDIYHEQAILRANVIPPERVLGNAQYRREMVGVEVPGGVYAHIAGVDIVRHSDGEYYVLEDNLRTPSGVSLSPEGGAHQSTVTPSLGVELPGLDFYEPAFAREVEWALLEALRQCCDREHGLSTYFRLSTKPVDQKLMDEALARLGEEEIRRQTLLGGYRIVDRRVAAPASSA